MLLFYLLTDKTMIKYGCRHVAIIMDGNGRWANKQGKIRAFGHEAGAKAVRRAILYSINNNINVLTLYALSKENWNRPIQEINTLIELFIKVLNSEVKNYYQHNVRLHIIGDNSCFNSKTKQLIHKAETLTANNTGLILNIAVNYGGRWDIIQGIQNLVKKVQTGILKLDQITEEVFSKYICMSKLPPVDLVIRTGGEYRISNFLLWQIAYSELYFTDVLWPDFNEEDFESALYAFSKRKRRFGNVKSLAIK